jgi:hypothetical protein
MDAGIAGLMIGGCARQAGVVDGVISTSRHAMMRPKPLALEMPLNRNV